MAVITWSHEYGGRGLALLEEVIVEEELVLHDAPVQLGAVGLIMVGPTLMRLGTPEQKQRYLPPMLRGDEIWCQGYSEPNAGSDLASVQSRAELQGDQFRVNGQKIWTTFAHMADWCFLLCRTDPVLPRHQGLSVLLVDMHSPGIEVRPIRQISGDAEFNEVFFTDVAVPRANLVGGLNDGWRVALTLLMFERPGTALALRLQTFLDRLVALARSERRGGAPMLADPCIRDRMAQYAIEVRAARLNYLRSLTGQLRRGLPGPEGSLEKLYATELHKRLHAFALELVGAEALAEGAPGNHPLEGDLGYTYLNSFMLTIAGGTSEIQRNIVAERLLGLPRG